MTHKRAFLLISVTFALGCFASAKPRAERLKTEFEKTKVSLIEDEVKQRRILGALFAINHKMKKIVGEKATLEQEKLLVENSVRELAVKISDLEQKTKAQKVLLRDRMAAMYKLGGQGMARLLFSSNSSAELERDLKILGLVAKRDMDLIKDYNESRTELSKRKEKLTIRWAHLQKLQKKISFKEQKLADENAIKNKILQNVRSSHAFAVMKLKDIRKKSRQVANEGESELLELLLQPSFFEQKGQLPKPIQGQLVQGFGLIKDEVHNVIMSHKGNFYAAPIGSPVKAIFQGKVAYAGTVPGFGQTLILDHGDHYYSVYSHNKALQVKEGEEVKQSQTLALSGQVGEDGNGNNGLYFEIRHFSEPSDPKLWMKGNSL